MNARYKTLQVLFLLAFILPGPSLAEIETPTGGDRLVSIQRYNVTSSFIEGSTLHRTITVVATNNTSETLYHVYLRPDGFPPHVITEGRAYFRELGVNVPTESNTEVHYTVDMSQQEASELEFVWQFEIMRNGERVIDEIAVKELIN